jgi:hypothetical protein
MDLNIGFVKSESQFQMLKLDTDAQEVSSNILDTIQIKESDLNLLFYSENQDLDGLNSTFSEENKFYPVFNADSLGIKLDDFEKYQAQDLLNLYSKATTRWILNNNIQTIEQLYSLVTYLRDLWSNDRNNFFEELWYILKTNLGTTELSLIFHDLIEGNEEKNEKAQLKYSICKGKKSPEIFDAKESENKIMEEYKNEFNDHFQITEYNSTKAQMVATIRIGLSPILIMAKVPQLNQLQQSILIGLFTGLGNK